MTTPDIYSYLSNQEFLRVHGDRIPEDLLPRVESLLEGVSRDEYGELEFEISTLQGDVDELYDENAALEREIEKLQKEYDSLEIDKETLEDEISDLKSELKHERFVHGD